MRCADVPDLTVVTNSIPVAQLLHESGTPGQTVVLTGGVRTPSDALVGPVAVARPALAARRPAVPRRPRHRRPRRADHAQPRRGRDQPGPRRLRPRGSCVLADHTKWGIVGLSTIAELSEVDLLVTDSGLSRPRPLRRSRRPSASSSSRPSRAQPGRAGGAARDRDRAPHQPAAGRRARDHLLRRQPGRPPRARPSTPATSTSERSPASCAGTRSPATGSPSPRTGRTAPSCRPRTSARCAPPGGAPALRDPRVRLRRRGLREPLPLLLRPRRGTDAADGARAVRARAGPRAVRGRLLHQRPRRERSPPSSRAGPHRHRGLGRPHRASWRGIPGSSRSSASRTAARRSA